MTVPYSPQTPAEERFLAECQNPERIVLGAGDRPDHASPETEIRAEMVRYVLLNDTSGLHSKGLRLRGAWISGRLDLQGCDCARDITLRDCVLAEPVNLVNAALRGLHISGSLLHGLSADNTRFSGSVYLRGGIHCEGEISLAGARISGDLQICDATIQSTGQDAIFAPSLHVDGSLFLGNYVYSEGITTLTTRGTIFFASAVVGHDMFVSNTAISLNDDILGGVFGATEEHGRDMALSVGRARIGGILYLAENQIGQGIVNLAGASVARFRDEPNGPGANYPIRLDGFRYGDFSRHADTDIAARLAWLERRPADTPFTAQPYEQLAHVLRGLGHQDDVNAVLIRKEQILRQSNRAMLLTEEGQSLRWATSGLWDFFLRIMVGYGYHPGRSLIMAILLIIGLAWFFDQTWKAGDMTPNAAPILVSDDWVSATQTHSDNPAQYWSAIGQAGQDWETFSPWAYATDLVVPLVSLGQESAWAPSTSRSDWGRTGWWLRWFAKGIGWVITALVAAAITGVIRRE
ncbi:hypothetical protein [Aestuariibius sp. HNIBRBA575]|uniref:hypothetical protein n=1 Tax=Aestuariibius sp. HNIBRBA575 TaxID=3233343 RepID=UPI0034A2C9B0